MPKFVLEITYRAVPQWTKENAHLFNPPADCDDPQGEERVYKDVVSARSAADAYRKALASRREAQPERRIYEDTVTGHSERKLP